LSLLIPLALVQGSPLGGGPIQLILSSGPVEKLVLLLLLAFSGISIGIIFYKGIVLRSAYTQSRVFLDVFRKSSKFSEVNSVCGQLRASPLVGVFQAGYLEVNQQVRGQQAQAGANPAPRTTVKSLESLSRALVRAATVEITRLERRVTFLATTASVTPFIGLFGTVWGIMNSFISIGAQKNASLDVVAPGIAEALIATAIGLAAAIPAVMAYNYFVRRINVLSSEMDSFSSEMLNIVRRHFLAS
jgi:biopolymer transport protein TolQ